MSRFILHLLPIAVLLSGLSARSQCSAPPQNVVTIQRDLDIIFKYALQQAQTLEAFQNNESIVEAGNRAGNFYLGTAKKEVEANAQLKKFETKSNPDYEYFLPVGYVPARVFSPHPSQKITFAFSTNDQVLKEIFVRDKTYRTNSGIRIGAALASVKKLVEGTERTAKQKIYWVTEGLTFVFEKGVLAEFVVFSEAKK